MLDFVTKFNFAKNMMTFLKGVSSYAGLTYFRSAISLAVHS